MDISREILQFLHYHPLSSRDEIAKGTAFEGSDATLKRLIAAGVQDGDIVVEGKARATRYRLSDQAHLLMPLNLDTYKIVSNCSLERGCFGLLDVHEFA